MKQAIVFDPEDLEGLAKALQLHFIKEFRMNHFVVEKPMTRLEAAAFVGYSGRRFDEFTRQGKFKAHRVSTGAGPRFLPSELLEAIRRS